MLVPDSTNFDELTVRLRDLVTNTELSSNAVAGIGGVFAPGGAWLYLATYERTLLGADHGRIVTSGGTTLYKAFAPPLTDKPTLAATGSGGVVTAGVHRVGYLIQTATGFAGRLSPVDSSTQLFDTTSAVTIAAGEKIDFELDIAWPQDAVLAYPVMTTADNLDRYFIVPGLDPEVIAGGTTHSICLLYTSDAADEL